MVAIPDRVLAACRPYFRESVGNFVVRKEFGYSSAYCRGTLRIHPEQVQVFTPTPSSYSTAMYRTSKDRRGRDVRVERSIQKRQRQKEIVTGRGRDGRHP